MSEHKENILNNVESLLRQDYRGVNIVVYVVATAGLAAAVHRIRPVSKFSTASKVPDHFIKKNEPLKGVYSGVQNSPVRVLIDHKAPIYLPLWHSSKPPLKVKLWGVNIASGNALNWLECVAKEKRVTFKPISREKEDLVSVVTLHLPQEKKKVEMLDIGQKLVELGFAKCEVPKNLKKHSLESKLAPILLSAEAKAKKYRNGIWADSLPPLPTYVVYWRKGSKFTKEISYEAAKTLLYGLAYVSQSALVGTKNLIMRPFRSSKQIQAT